MVKRPISKILEDTDLDGLNYNFAMACKFFREQYHCDPGYDPEYEPEPHDDPKQIAHLEEALNSTGLGPQGL